MVWIEELKKEKKRLIKKTGCQDCREAIITCECKSCGKLLCEFCFDENHKYGACENTT